MSFDGSKNLYEADYSTDEIQKSTPTTFYTISAMLPAGLSFNSSTGLISGSPTTVTAAANYTITAYNSSGNSSVTISITVAKAPSITYKPIQLYVYCRRCKYYSCADKYRRCGSYLCV